MVPVNHSMEEESVKSLPVSQHTLELEADSRKSIASSASQAPHQGHTSTHLTLPETSAKAMPTESNQKGFQVFSIWGRLHSC